MKFSNRSLHWGGGQYLLSMFLHHFFLHRMPFLNSVSLSSDLVASINNYAFVRIQAKILFFFFYQRVFFDFSEKTYILTNQKIQPIFIYTHIFMIFSNTFHVLMFVSMQSHNVPEINAQPAFTCCLQVMRSLHTACTWGGKGEILGQ